ncbi:MAG: MBL fold metallo-hydrolase, partial [Acutalibacteraceae bacterium]
VGVYYLGENEVMLIDSCDHKKSVKDLDLALSERGWKVKFIVNTHSHLDHIHGNDFFREKYGCEIYAPETERLFVDVLALERTAYFTAVPMRAPFDPTYVPTKERTKLLTKDILPVGFDIVSLPGHTLNMVGIKTADGVWFTADSVLAKETFEGYGIPFFLLVNQSIETAKNVAALQGNYFVPAHAKACESIKELALYNAESLIKLKSFIESIADGRSLEGILKEADRQMSLDFNPDKYTKISVTVKGMLQGLIDDGKITADIIDGRMVYKKI